MRGTLGYIFVLLNLLAKSNIMIVQLTLEDQTRALYQSRLACYHRMFAEESNITETYCNRTWDSIMCWPDTPAGTVVYQACPAHINGFDTEETASRICLSNGTWFSHPGLNGSNSGWTNFTSCLTQTSLHVTKHPEIDLGVAKIVLKHINEFRLMYNIGYALSLICLLLAVAIMLYFRKLRCPRNIIHMNLFLSFILRASMSTIKENMFVQNIGFAGDVGYLDNTTLYFKEGPHWECRLFFSLFQYVLSASYIWIFVEGLYLHMLIFVSVFTERSRITWYMVLGWTFPVPFVIAWVISRIYVDNTLCWNTSINSPGLTWIMKGPVMAAMALNFLFFISIVRVLFTKLTSSHCPESKRQRYRRLARSTLVLIPIFGVYYTVFTFPMDRLDDTTSFIMLFIEMFFNSYQGVIIAILLCFVNAEVRSEIQKAWNRHRLRRSSAGSVNQSQYRTYRSSSDGRASETNNIGALLRKYRTGVKKNTSATDLEETSPFGLGNKYDTVSNGKPQTAGNNAFTGNDVLQSKIDSETRINTKCNGNKPGEDVELKINILTIQYSTKDNINRNLSTVDIEALQNGTTIKETTYTNNNTCSNENTEPDKSEESGNLTMDNETFFLVS